jgi:hypothetical protein
MITCYHVPLFIAIHLKDKYRINVFATFYIVQKVNLKKIYYFLKICYHTKVQDPTSIVVASVILTSEICAVVTLSMVGI